MSAVTGEYLGWADRVMSVLRVLVQLVLVNAMLVLGTLAGGVILGAAPAAASAGAIATDLVRGRAVDWPWRSFWQEWARSWKRANLVAAPFWFVLAALLLDSWILQSAAGGIRVVLGLGLVLLAAWSAVALCYLPRVVSAHKDSVLRTWTFLVLAPGLFPATAAACLVCVAAVAAVTWFVPLAGVLLGGAVLLGLTGRLVAMTMVRAVR